jgi:hypothetical protein
MRRALLPLLLMAVATFAAAQGRTPLPAVQKAAAGTQCVAPPAEMRRNHMELLRHQRDDTVRGGVRGAKPQPAGLHRLPRGCADARVNQAPVTSASAATSYAAVKIDCFECHSGKRQAAR